MAKKILKFTDAQDFIRVGAFNWDDSGNYDVYAYGGDDDFESYVDGTLWADLGDGDDVARVNGSGSTTIYGDNGDDRMEHKENDFDDGLARFYGEEGDDHLISFVSGADILDGGSGDDTLDLSAGNKGVGGTGDDDYYLVRVNSQSDVTIVEYANNGYDKITASFSVFNWIANIEQYNAISDNNVTINGNDSANVASLKGGNDYAKMNGGDDMVYGQGGSDKLLGDAGNDTLSGGAGKDQLFGGTGNDVLFGGDGELGNVSGTSDSDDALYGEDGDDRLFGGQGVDLLSGGAGNDYLSGGGAGVSYDSLFGGLGNDTYFDDGKGVITELANQGTDTIEFFGATITIAANVENLVHAVHPYGAAYNPVATTVTGNAMANSITGNGYANTMTGEAGNDTMFGQGGNDKLRGGEGNDVILGDDGDDQAYGDNGNDKIAGGNGADAIYGGAGNDELGGNAGADFIIGDLGNDIIYGGSEDDYINGGSGYDNLYGEDGNDTLRAGIMNDYVYGNAGNDKLHGEEGSDFLWGGAGADRFMYTNVKHSRIGDGIDQIKDFERGLDRIDVSAIDATPLSGDQAFTWAGMSTPAAKAGNLWGQSFAASAYNPEFVRVYADVNGDGVADMSIDVMGQRALGASDFVL